MVSKLGVGFFFRTGGEKASSSLDVPLHSQDLSAEAETLTLANATDDPSATPNSIRPTNPTPAHATGNGTPTPVRPTNPTPLQASTTVNPRPSNPTPKQASEPLSQESPLHGDSPQWTTNLESVQEVDVTSSMGEVVEGPVEADDPDDVDNVPMFSGMFILLVECLPVAHSDGEARGIFETVENGGRYPIGT